MNKGEPYTSIEDDASLMIAIGRADRRAFETLYDCYAPQLYGICICILKNESDANDALSDIFLEIWQKATRYSPDRGSVRQYLMTLARCRAIDHLRKRTSRTVSQDVFLQQALDCLITNRISEQPENRAVSAEEKALLAEAINSLPESSRQLLTMAFFDGLTHVEIAEQVRLPLGTVKTVIRRSIQQLQESMQHVNVTESSS